MKNDTASVTKQYCQVSLINVISIYAAALDTPLSSPRPVTSPVTTLARHELSGTASSGWVPRPLEGSSLLGSLLNAVDKLRCATLRYAV